MVCIFLNVMCEEFWDIIRQNQIRTFIGEQKETCLANPVPVVVVKTPFWCQTFPVQSLSHCHHMGCPKILKSKVYPGFHPGIENT